MAREISYRITVDDGEAKAKVAAFDQSLAGAGTSATTATAGVVNLDRATAALAQTQSLATATTEELDAMIAGQTVALGTATTATEAATVASVEATTAAAGFSTALGSAATMVSGFVATIAPWLVAIGVAVELIKKYVDSQREAVKAEAEHLQQTDLLTRATLEAGHAVMDLKEAEKILEAAQRHRLLLIPELAAQSYIDKLSEQAKKTMEAAAEEAARTEGLAAQGLVVGDAINVEQMMTEARKKAAEAAKATSKANQEYFDAVVKLSNKIYDMENPLRDTVLLMADLAKVGKVVTDGSKEILKAWDDLVRKLEELQNKSKVGIVDISSLPLDIETIGRLKEKFDDAEKARQQFHKGLNDLSQAFSQLAQVSGGSLGTAVREMGQIVASINLAITAMENLSNATQNWIGKLSNALSVVTAIYQIGMTLMQIIPTFGDFTNAKQGQNFATLADFIKSLNLTAEEFVEKMKRAGLSIQQLIADAHDMKKFQEDLERIKKAFEEIDAAAQHTKDLLDEASSKYGPSQADLEAAEKHAHELFDAMLKAGTYTQEQLNKAYYDWQKAMADAGNEAAKAWIKAHDAAAGAIQAQSDAVKKLQSRYDELNQAVSQEAPEAEMGAIEKQQRAEMDHLKQQIDEANKAAQAQADAQTGAASDANDSWQKYTHDWNDYVKAQGDDAAQHLEDTFGSIDIHIPVHFDVDSLPVVPQASGGDWMVNKPTLFLAGEAGPERATFTPMGGRQSSASGSTDAGVVIQKVEIHATDANSFRRLLQSEPQVIGQAAIAGILRGGRSFEQFRRLSNQVA